MGVRENKQLIKQLYEEGLPAGAAALDQYFAPDYAAHGLWRDLVGLKSTMEAFLEAWPHAEWEVLDMVGELDKVAVRGRIKLRNAGGVVRTIGSTMIFRIANNRIVEQWGHGEALF